MDYRIIFVAIGVFGISLGEEDAPRTFPKDFKFGVSTAAFQIEGAWNASDKGMSIWDHVIHNHPEVVDDLSTGDVACDSYRNYRRDVKMLVELGVDFYRFSISWPRLIPTGIIGNISEDGFRYYDSLINELLANKIEPVVTLYHWDLPQGLQEIGGWTNPAIADYYEDYVNLVFMLYGDRVKTWLTFNEPQVFCVQGYGRDSMAPRLNYSGIGEYLCGHTVLRAHAKAYHLYNDAYKAKQGGRVGLTLNVSYKEPDSPSEEDREAADRSIEFELGWFAHPIFSQTGGYPMVMKENIAIRSQEQGYRRSRLPEFTREELESIRGSSDFLGINHYTTFMVRNVNETDEYPSYENDRGADHLKDPSWPKSASKWLSVVPWGFRKILNWISDRYNNPEIMIFECGYSDEGMIHDKNRVEYLHDYLGNMVDSINEGCNVTAFSAWSLMDNMEWFRGYKERFGLYYVHYDTPDKKREPKDSAKYYKEVIKARKVIKVTVDDG